MASKKRSEDKYLIFIIAGFLLSSATVFLIPFASFKEHGIAYTLAYAIGGVFWLGLIISLIAMIILNFRRVKNEKGSKKAIKYGTIGLFKFFSNKAAVIFDAAFILSAIVQIALIIIGVDNQIISIIVLFLIVFTFEMHCVFNGRNYFYLRKTKET